MDEPNTPRRAPTGDDLPAMGKLGPPPEPLPIEEITSSVTSAPRFKVVREVGRTVDPPLVRPRTLRLDGDGAILVVEQLSDTRFRLRKLASDGDATEMLADFSKGVGEHEIAEPVSIAVDERGQFYLLDASVGVVKKFSADGRWLDTFDAVGAAGMALAHPGDLALDHKGNLYVADTNNDRVVQLSPSGEPRWEISQFDNAGGEGDELYEPASVCIIGAGDLYVADSNHNRVLHFDVNRRLILTIDGPEQFAFPTRVRVSADGRRVYVADQSGSRVQRFDETGKPTATLVVSGHGSPHDEIQGGADFDVDREGHIMMLNPVRESVVVLDFLEA